ncbi:glycosyltransferase [Vibrio vulnificus]|nr:glycosyltransferase [Vibrio vulnificus]
MSYKRKVLIFIPSLVGGGAEKNALLMAEALVDLNFNVILAYMYENKSGTEPSTAISYEYIGKKPTPFQDIFNFRRTIKKVNPDYVVSFLDVINIYTFFAKFGLKHIKHIANERSNPFYHLKTKRFGKIKLWLLRLVYRKVDRLFVNSMATTRQIIEEMGVSEISAKVLYNPISLNIKSACSERKKGSILAVGRLDNEKDYPTLLRAISELVHTHNQNDFVLNIAGKGPLLHFLEDLVSALGISEYVNFLGFRSDVSSLMLSHEIYVLSSQHEGFPNTLLEAMSCGMAVVSTDCVSGPGEVIQDSSNGYLVSVGDYKAMAERILILLNSEQRLSKIATSATASLGDFSFSNYKKSLKESFDTFSAIK